MGARMTTRNGDGKQRRLYYFCPAARRKTTQCSNHNFYRAVYIDTAIWSWIKDFLSNPQVAESGLAEFVKQSEQTVSLIQERSKIIKGFLDDDNTQFKTGRKNLGTGK